MNFNILGGFLKNEYFLGYENFVDIFWGHHKIELYLGPRSFLCILGSFLNRVKVQNGGYFGGLLKFQIFFRVLEIPDIFWG